MTTNAVQFNNIFYVAAANTQLRLETVGRVTYGFMPLGNGNLTTVGADAGNLVQSFGFRGVGLANSIDDDYATALLWRLSSSSAAIPTWQLVENNVVLATLSGANLTGGLTNKFCRASIVFPTPTTFYGIFQNLSDNATFTTATFTATSPSNLQQMYLHSGTRNATAKVIAFDYIMFQIGCKPVGYLASESDVTNYR